MKNLLTGSAAIALIAGAAIYGAPALAQSADEGASTSPLGDIVVTAQRREQSLQDVPIAIAAISGEAMARGGIQNTQDLAVATPGLTMTSTLKGMTPYLRGIGTSSGFVDGSVSVYVDNVYYASTTGSTIGLNNVERVEVLKGPQGTLFGRNATGGLVHVITRDPSDTPELKVSVGYSNYDTWMGNIYATGALADGVTMNLSLYGNRQGNGWGRNLNLGNDINYRREWSARSKLKIDLGERTTILLSADYAWLRTDLGLPKQAIPGAIAQGGIPHVGSIYDGNSDLPFDASAIFGDGIDSHQYGFSGVLTQELSDSVTLTSITAYRRFRTKSYVDNDLTPIQFLSAYLEEPARSFQQEILLNGNMSRIDWTVGGIYYSARTGYAPRIFRSIIVPALNSRLESPVWAKSYAFFGQGSYRLTDATTLTLGARYTIDRTHIEAVTYATPGNALPDGTVIAALGTEGQPDSRTRAGWERPTWRIALDHKLSRDLLIYASYNRGYKAGAFNPSTPPSASNATPDADGNRIGDAVDPEKLDAYEIGFKSDLLDRQLRFNASAFYYDYKNIQLLQLTPQNTANLFNAGAARIKGVELESVLAPHLSFGRLELRASASFLDAEYTEAVNMPSYIPLDAGGNLPSILADASGNRVIKTPKFSSTLGLDYALPVGSALEAGVNVNWAHTSRIYWEVDNRLTQAPTDIVNAQLSFGSMDEAWRIRLWARNLTDEKYFSTVSSAPTGDLGSPAAPRAYGVTLDFKFGGS